MGKLGMIGMTVLTLSTGQALGSQVLKCEKKSGLANGCITSLSMKIINKFQYHYEFIRTDDGIGFCTTKDEIDKSGTVFRSHYDFFENDEVEITVDRTPASDAFVTVFFSQGHAPDSFKSSECESIYQ
jgi:hypothetical protein